MRHKVSLASDKNKRNAGVMEYAKWKIVYMCLHRCSC